MIPTKRVKGSVGEGEVGKKAKETHHTGGQSVSEKYQSTRTSKNLFEKSNNKTQYFVRTQDTLEDVLQDTSVHQLSVLSDLLGGSTSMDVDVDIFGVRAKYLHESASGAP